MRIFGQIIFVMMYSMTGYGKALVELPSKKITIEIKSLNSKNFDLNCRISSVYREKEMDIRKQLSAALERGKVDFSLFAEQANDSGSTQINKAIVRQYMNELQALVDADQTDLLQMAIRLPDATTIAREELDETEWSAIQKGIDESITAIGYFRRQEGKALETDLRLRIQNIYDLLDEIALMDPERLAGIRERLEKAVADLKTDVDPNRFEQELIYYLEKLDITEEKVRLQNHLEFFSKTMNGKQSNGKKLGFIAQEIGREINTIGSKSNFAPMQKLVVQMKDELEKVKEQLLNVL